MNKPRKQGKDGAVGHDEASKNTWGNERLILETLPLAVIITRLDGKILFANQHANRQVGFDIMASGQTILDFYANPKQREQVVETLQRDGRLDDYELAIRRGDGSVLWSLLSTRQFEFEGTAALLSSVVDITARKQAEEALRKEQEKAQHYLDIAGTMIVIIEPGQTISLVNKKACEILGYEETELIGRNWFETVIPEGIRESIRAGFAELVAGKVEPWEYIENPVLTKTHEQRIIAWHNSVLRNDDGEIIATLSSGNDISEQNLTLAELQARDRYLTLMNITTSDILNPKTPDERYYYLANHMANLFVADFAYIVRWDAGRERAVLIATTASSGQNPHDVTFSPGEASITETVLKAKAPLVIEDVPNSEYSANSCFFTQDPFTTQSALGIPLIARDSWVGAMILLYNKPHHFTPEDVRHAQQAGQQVALVLWTIQQEADAQKRLLETNALVAIGTALSETERVGIKTVFQLIADLTKELIPSAEQVVLHTTSEDGKYLIPQAVASSRHPKRVNSQLRIDKSIAGEVLVKGDIVIVPDAKSDNRFSKQTEEIWFHSLMVAPVQSNMQKLGTISVQSKLPDVFTQEESRMLNALATQAAIAIENANLLEATRQSLNESNSLYQIIRGLVSSLDPNELMSDVVNLLQNTFNYYYVQIFVVDPESGDFVIRAGSGETGKKLVEMKHHISPGEGIVGHTAEVGSAFYTNNVDEFHFFVRNILLPETKCELAVPVKINNQILGLLDIQQTSARDFTERDVQLVSAVADQLALALQKASLHAKLQEVLRQEQETRSQLIQSEKLNVAGRLLASVSHELNNPLQAIQNALFLLKKEKGLSLQGRQDLGIVLSETERMATMLDRLRTTYQPVRAEDFQLVQINDIIEDVFALVSTHLRHNRISFEFHSDPDLPHIPGLVSQLKQVFLNLFLNAVDAMPGGGNLTVSTKMLMESREALITVSDTGTGVEDTIMPNIFDAFVTNKERGTGLGLTISHEIIHKHGGHFQAKNNPEKGATFSIWLPLERGEA